MRHALVGCLVLVACGDNTVPADAAAGPDLTLLGMQMAPTLIVTDESFDATDCAIAEGCVGGPGVRRLLRFDTVTANTGTVDLALGPIPAAGESNDVYVWSPCHMHHHIRGYAEYRLLDGDAVVVAGHKQAFCLQDTQQLRPDLPGQGFTCTMQGLSAGWADTYGRELPCQWIDISSVAPGSYTLSVRINVEARLDETRLDNDAWTTPVSL